MSAGMKASAISCRSYTYVWKGEAEGIAYENALREQWKQRR